MVLILEVMVIRLVIVESIIAKIKRKLSFES